MRIELVATGDELVTGLTVDTNSAYLEERLFARGEKPQRVVVVGDVREEITRALKEAAARSDLVFVSGGLGPTADDFTVECAAEAAGVPLELDERVLASLRARFARRNLAFTENNARQARVPRGAEVVPNPVGSAPMFIVTMGEAKLFFLPGVPREFRALVDQEILPRVEPLIAAQPGRTHRAFTLLRTMGIPESHLDARMSPVAARHPRVVFGYRTHAPENQLKLMAEAASEVEATEALRAAEQECVAELGDAVFGKDGVEFVEAVATGLIEAGATVALAESCTGGWATSLLSAVPGISSVLRGGVVVYTERMKTEWAGVPADLIEEHGAVSDVVGRALAEGIRTRAEATYGVGVTGYAGPGGGTAADPVGTVYLAVSGPRGTRSERHLFPGDRQRVRRFAAAHALDLLRRTLLEEGRS